MLWELIATASCAFAAAGIILMLRVFWKKQPKWLIPAAAGVGMLAFQIYSEYTWFAHTSSRLPRGAVVVAEIAQPVFYQPWSYLRAPVLQFAVVDKNSQTDQQQPQHKITQLYFFERRMSAKTLPIAVDCAQKRYANIINGQIGNWDNTAYTAKIVQAVCGV